MDDRIIIKDLKVGYKTMMFDYVSLARRHNIDQDTLEQILGELHEEFPDDEMMVGLHGIRIIKRMGEQEE
ncbi:MAG: hypothetical protein AB1796_02505 [Bacillota bacterium]